MHRRCLTEWSACDSLPIDHVDARGLLPEVDHPVRNPVTVAEGCGSLLANVRCGLFSFGSGSRRFLQSRLMGVHMLLRLGIDIACRAAHQVSLADEQGRFLWTGHRFYTTPGFDPSVEHAS